MLAAALALLAAAGASADEERAFIPKLVNTTTVPANGDVNPYGVAFVPKGFPAGGAIAAGDVLVSNFNNSANLQGTGTTIVQWTPGKPLAPPGSAVVFFQSEAAGLSTALGALRAGFVIVGNVPTTDGSIATIGKGGLQVIDRNGKRLATWTDPVLLDGPWDLTIADDGSYARIFVSNALNGTVVRLEVAVSPKGVELLKKTLIASGYTHEPNMGALILGPTGLALDAASDTLYVASTADNAIYAIDNASHAASAVWRGHRVFADSRLRGPLALRFAPGGHLLAANGDAVNAALTEPSEIVEFTRQGEFVRQYDVDSTQGGAFGIDTVLESEPGEFNYAVIDDVTNNLAVYRLRPH
jgi:hypothetical protein